MAHEANAHGHGEAAHAEHHIPSLAQYFGTFGALMVLLFLTVGVAQLDLGAFNIVAALIIAVMKTTLVILIFMNVKNSSRLTWLWAGIGFLWLIFMFGTLGDYVTRNWIRVEGW